MLSAIPVFDFEALLQIEQPFFYDAHDFCLVLHVKSIFTEANPFLLFQAFFLPLAAFFLLQQFQYLIILRPHVQPLITLTPFSLILHLVTLLHFKLFLKYQQFFIKVYQELSLIRSAPLIISLNDLFQFQVIFFIPSNFHYELFLFIQDQFYAFLQF